MKFYISSSLQNVGRVRALSRRLKAAGWEQSYDWTVHCTGQEIDLDALRSIGEAEFEGVRRADAVIVLTPQGRGTHAELGMALALGKRVYLCHDDDTFFKCDENTSAFYWLSQVNRIVGGLDDIARALLEAQNP